MNECTYLPVKILALRFHQSPKTVRQNINEMSKDPEFCAFVINPREKGAPKLADLGAYALWIQWKPQRKSYLWNTVYRPKVKELLSNIAIGAGWLLMLLLILGTGLHVWASPIRDGVHTPVYPSLMSIDRTEIADMRDAEEWSETQRFTDRERDLLLRVMMCEAGNQGATGQALVGRVVLNRVNSSRFPGSIEAVLFQPGQFSTASYLYRYEPNTDCYEALEFLENGWDESQGALYFCTTSFSWATYLFTYRAHNFFC